MTTTADVVVVGAGLAGLTAARRLRAEQASVIVLEARDRVGGRTLSQRIGRHWFDLGGQWIGPGQDRMAGLAAELGLETFDTYDRGRKILDLDGKRSTYTRTIPRLGPARLAWLQRGISSVDRAAGRVDPRAPWAAREARTLDAETVGNWEERRIRSRAARALFDVGVRTIFGAEPAELSLLYFLAYARAGGGLMPLVSVGGGAQQTRFVAGAQHVAAGMAEALRDAVLTMAPAREIVQSESAVEVRTDARTFRARYAVVAMAPAMAARIGFTPALDPTRDEMLRRFGMGATSKFHAFYPEPFWRAEGLSGEVVATGGPVSVVFDNSPPGEGAPGALLAFAVGRHARALSRMDAEGRRALVLEQLGRWFGPRAAQPDAFVEKDWAADPWTRGCPTGVLGPGLLAPYGELLRAPHGRVHWAGTETAARWTGYMEGAVDSGERAAAEILGRLNGAQA